MPQRSLFILVGNGPYDNRGCEAIVRGTVEILSKHFEDSRFLIHSNFVSQEQYLRQIYNEHDKRITHKSLVHSKRFSTKWIYENAIERLSPRLFREYLYKDMLKYLPAAKAVLSIGGDNYSLDYGKPKLFLDLNELVISRKKPLIIWGASIGPFSSNPSYEKFVIENLKKVVVFARESETIDYLASRGLKDNVFQVADPAFLLKSVEPVLEQPIADEALGINLSPLMARYISDCDYKKWVVLAADIAREICVVTRRKIYLIPHATSPLDNDYTFLCDVLSLLQGLDIVLIPDRYNAGETKWIIGKMTAFAGSRTHSTIAALSMCVPTLSFAYSIKSMGINRDMFGHEKFCITKDDCQAALVAEKIKDLLTEGASIREQLKIIVPEFQRKALSAGEKLLEVCD